MLRKSITQFIFRQEYLFKSKIFSRIYAYLMFRFKDISITREKKRKINNLLDELQLKSFENIKKFRLGGKNDGGYVLIDLDLDYSILFSYGIGKDIAFEEDFSGKFNSTVYMFDHTVNDIKSNDPHLIFMKEGLSTRKKPGFNTLMEHYYKNANGNQGNLFLKIDIEGDEWEVLQQLDNDILSKFSQIIIEFHHMNSINNTSLQEKIEVFKKLNMHFHLLHAHGNNFSHILSWQGFKLVNVLELTFVRKDQIKERIHMNNSSLPISCDAPNYSYLPEIKLDFYPFKMRSADDQLVSSIK
ncbi:MAG: FkbM family methyltransferase [Candidatus Heimdallarchaeota archaeon]|nr:FkbM family methyltransferase [Candidatus Heimdallarchaeota archaeon]